MPPVILTGSFAVKGVVVIADKAVSPFWVFPNPVLERLFYHLLLRLCRRGFLVVEYRFFIAVFIINIVENASVFQI